MEIKDVSIKVEVSNIEEVKRKANDLIDLLEQANQIVSEISEKLQS